MNKHPNIKTWVKNPGGADTYENLTIKYVPGHNPDLVLFDGDAEVERIDLTKLGAPTTAEHLHELMKEKGLVLKSEL